MIRQSRRVAITLGALVFAAVTWQGCQSTPTSPILDSAASFTPAATHDGATSEWTVVASSKLNAGQDGTLTGSRYTLDIPKGALHNATTVTISERHPSILEVKFGPDGLAFEQPATLTIDYSGTLFDRTHSTATNLHVFGYDAVGSRWVRMPGSDDASTRLYTTQLEHFSRYALSDATPILPTPNPAKRQNGEDVESR